MIVITGYPSTGKTTLASLLAAVLKTEYRSTDTLIDTYDWSDLSAAVSKWFDEPCAIIEGVAVPRALRKWRERNPSAAPPFEFFVYMRASFATMRPEHRAMAKGIDTVMQELWKWLGDVPIFQFGPR